MVDSCWKISRDITKLIQELCYIFEYAFGGGGGGLGLENSFELILHKMDEF